MIAVCGLSAASKAQSQAYPSCDTVELERATNFHGNWQLELGTSADGTALAQRGDLVLGPNPDLADSFAGRAQRGGRLYHVAGDVEGGLFTLEESADGTTVTANWVGEVDARTCGREVHGTWTNLQTGQTHRFVLRRGNGWN